MKKRIFKLSVIIIIFPTLLWSQGLKEKFIFPELDAALISLWLDTHKEDSSLQYPISNLIEAWLPVRKSVASLDIIHFNNENFITDIDTLIHIINVSYEKGNDAHLASYTYHLLWEFRAIRECFLKSEYPLDKLFDVYEQHEKISWVVKDQLMGLTEWFEFEDIIQDYMCSWDNYNHMSPNSIQKYNPNINIPLHNRLKENLEECNYALMVAVDTGYQDNFQMPCDRIEEALYALFKLYTHQLIKFDL